MDSRELAWLIRRHAIEMTHRSGGSHIGSILSVTDIVAVLYADILRYDATQPDLATRDRFILSKGHAGIAVYAALAECGFFPVQELQEYYKNGSRLSGHVSHRVPGVEFSTGSLGHGLSVALGMAIVAQKSAKQYKVYIVIGDGECNEGSVWEAAMFAKLLKLDNLVVIVDYNKMQSMDYTDKTMALESLADKWRAFGWAVSEIDGHNHDQLKSVLQKIGRDSSMPQIVIAHTTKGKGVSFMENSILWHYRYPHTGWEYDQAVCELHTAKSPNTVDPYTPAGIVNPQPIPPDADSSGHELSVTWKPKKT